MCVTGDLKVGGFERTPGRSQKEPHFKRTVQPETRVSGESLVHIPIHRGSDAVRSADQVRAKPTLQYLVIVM